MKNVVKSDCCCGKGFEIFLSLTLPSISPIKFFFNKNIKFNTLFYFIQYISKAIGITGDAGNNFTSFNYNDYIKLFFYNYVHP